MPAGWFRDELLHFPHLSSVTSPTSPNFSQPLPLHPPLPLPHLPPLPLLSLLPLASCRGWSFLANCKSAQTCLMSLADSHHESLIYLHIKQCVCTHCFVHFCLPLPPTACVAGWFNTCQTCWRKQMENYASLLAAKSSNEDMTNIRRKYWIWPSPATCLG